MRIHRAFRIRAFYEPHLVVLEDGSVGAMYANELHVGERPSHSQIISERISLDNGTSWGPEIWFATAPGCQLSRPGMPVWTRLPGGRYIVVYEVVDRDGADVHFKVSNDGMTWPPGLGTRIADQWGGPFVTSLPNGMLLVTSNAGHVSWSLDAGATWTTDPAVPWPDYQDAPGGCLWSSIVDFGGEIGAVTSAPRSAGGHAIQIRFGTLGEPVAAKKDGAVR